MKIVVAGGSGFLGRLLRKHFSVQGHDVINLTRNPSMDRGAGASVAWDGKTQGPWTAVLAGSDVLINLSGKSVDCRYNAKNKAAIYASRLGSTRALGEAIAACTSPPSLWLNAASATIYRHAEDRPMDEERGEFGDGFSVDVCRRWETCFFDAPIPDSIRRVALRTAIVLGRDGGALGPLRMLARLGLGGKQGNGNQYFSWIHEADFIGIVEHVIAHNELSGSINVSAPEPVRCREFMAALRKACGVPFGLPTPAWLLEIGAVLIRTETELVLKSRWVIPKRLLESGYVFRFSEVEGAFDDLMG